MQYAVEVNLLSNNNKSSINFLLSGCKEGGISMAGIVGVS